MPNTVFENMVEDHDALMDNLYDASIAQALGGLGGCKHFEITDYPAKFRPYITSYLSNEDQWASRTVLEYLTKEYSLLYGRDLMEDL